jgi:aspartyl protease family protein
MLRSTLGAFFLLAVASLGLVSYVTKHGGLNSPIVAMPAPAPRNAAVPIAPAAPVTAAAAQKREAILTANAQGHFAAGVYIDGLRIPMLVDTGASFVSLSNEDAARLGLHPTAADFRVPMSTANGVAYAAKVHLWRVNIGDVEIYDVDAVVNPPGSLKTSLLGMSALRKLRNFEFSGGRLVLEQ